MREPVPSHIQKLAPYVPGKPAEQVSRELGIREAVKLASNENPLGPSPRALEAAAKALERVHLYPDAQAFDLRNRLSQLSKLPLSQVLLGAGAVEIIELVARTFLGHDGNAVIADNSFIHFSLATQAVNGNRVMVPLRNDHYDLDAMADAITSSTRVVFIANPNNPTGTIVSAEAIDRFLARIPQEVVVVLDEAYREYVTDSAYPEEDRYWHSHPNVVVLRTFSKVYGLAGLRIGYAIGPDRLFRYIQRVRAPFNTSIPAQAAALAALEDQEHILRSIELNRVEKRFVEDRLTEAKISFVPSQANFVMVRPGRPCEEIAQDLLQEGVIVRPLTAFGFDDAIRVTTATREQNLKFLAALVKTVANR